MSKCPVRTVHTPVAKVGRLTIELIEPHGSAGGLGLAETAGEGDGNAVAGVCASASVLKAPNAPRNDAVAISRLQFNMAPRL
jgi:hypothetical protein